MDFSFNTIKEIRAGYSLIEGHALRSGGIIYGGYVRDEVIKDECTVRFMEEHSELKKNERIEKYWDETYHSETSDRLLIPDDIDISFNSKNNLKTFIHRIENEHFFKIIKMEENNLYDHFNIEIFHIKYKIVSLLGKTFTYKGLEVVFNIDICMTYLEPPFFKCDMYSNCLVKDFKGIRISNNNGIYDRCLRPYKAVMLTGKIIESIIKKETYLTVSCAVDIVSAIRIIKRISKMVKKDFTIKNISWLTKNKDKSEICLICQNEKAEISIKRGSHFHKECLIEFFDHVEFFSDEGGYYFNSPLKEKCYMRFVNEWIYD
jgi:hypothetical protein